MKILLVSDTHGRNLNLEDVLDIETPDFLCHMGDLEGSEDYIRLITKCPLAMVSGNNDFWTDLNPEVTFELQGFRIFMTHGHRYCAHAGNEQLKSAGRRNKADIVLFGHTHRPTLEFDEDIIVANPGSLTYPRQEKRRPSYMVLYLEKGKVPKFETKFL
jgi:putative phosphoesterase